MGVLAMLDMLDTHMPTMERDLLMLSQRLMLIPIFSMEDMDMVLAMLDMVLDMDMVLDTEPTDTHMPTTERDPLMLNQRLMLMLTMDTMDMPDLMPMDMV